MGGFEKDDASSTELVVHFREENPAGTEDDQGEKVEGRVEVGESVGCRCLEDVDAVNVEVLLPGVGDDARKGVRQHT